MLGRRARRRPNLLFLMADDHAAYVIGGHGSRLAGTPNLGRLARERVRFASHFCNSPVCTPSRGRMKDQSDLCLRPRDARPQAWERRNSASVCGFSSTQKAYTEMIVPTGTFNR